MKRTVIDRYRDLDESNVIPQIVYDVARLERQLAEAKSDMYSELRKHWTRDELRQVGIVKTRGAI